MRRSRLSERLEKKSRNSLLLSIVGMLILSFLLIKFGIPFLANASLFFSGSQTNENTTKKKDLFVAPPVLNSLFNATASAQISVSGIGAEKQKISLYVNDEKVDTVETKSDKMFEFQNVTLKKGENRIKAKAITENDQESDFSTEQVVMHITEPPSLVLDSPSDGQTFSKDQNSITVKGKTDSGVKVTVNDFWAITDPNGTFTYTMQLNSGDNPIKIVATDAAGNKTEKEIKVVFNP